ncbi:hypothetical protein MKX01_028841 [Papaver californicum]|nr:hypothetical protein MKX01_028841 [Papaver californicum]
MAVAADKGVVVVVDDVGGDMQCSNHPYKNNNNPGGICAFCLQEKLGRLVSSSKSDTSFFPVNTPPSTAAAAGDSSSSPSSLITARSSNSGLGTSNSINIKNAAAALALGTASSSAHDNNNKTTTVTTSNMMIMTSGTNSNVHHNLLSTSQKKSRKSLIATANSSSSSSLSSLQHQNNKLVMLKRSKSSAASNTRRIISHEPRHQIFDNDDDEEGELGTDEYTPTAKSATRNKHHRGFWSSFLHLSSASNRTSKRTIRSGPYGERDHRDRVAVVSNTTATNANIKAISSTIAEKEKQLRGGNERSSTNGVPAASSSTRTADAIGGYGDENDSPNSSSHASSSSNSFGRKVARSRSVGCGSRSFSGAFLEKISTGFGDCSTLRRVESQRESSTTNSNYHNTNDKMVAVDNHHRHNRHHRHIKERVKCGGIFGGFTMTNASNSISNGGRVVAAVVGPPHGRSKNWGWAFASPMRAFRPPTSSSSSSSSKPDGSVVVAAAPKDIWFV